LKLKILKKLRTAILNSEFTGSYKKCIIILRTFLETLKVARTDRIIGLPRQDAADVRRLFRLQAFLMFYEDFQNPRRRFCKNPLININAAKTK